MTNPTIERAIAARDAAGNRLDNLEPGASPGIKKAVWLEYEAAKARVDGLIEEERREQGIVARPIDDQAIVISINDPRYEPWQRLMLAKATLEAIGCRLDVTEREALSRIVAESRQNPE